MDHLSFVEAVDGFGEGIVPGPALPARGQAPLSPTLPTEGSMPAAASRSVYLIERYCTPRTPFYLSSSNAGLVDLPLALLDEHEHFTRDVALAPSTCAAVVEAIRAAWAGRPDGYAKAATPVTSVQV